MQVRSLDSRVRLEQFVEAEREVLLKTLRYYVLRAGLANSSSAWSVAEELFQESILEGFRSADRLKPDLHPKPWLLSIAANLIKRKQVEAAKRNRREPLLRDLYPQSQAALSDEELFDQLPIVSDTSFDDLEVNEQLALLSKGFFTII
jgi:DNA-directed RNA polymerase specialized sigma24 family protein